MPEIAVQNVMAFVRDEGISVGILAKRNRSSQSGDSLRDHRLRQAQELPGLGDALTDGLIRFHVV